MGMLLRKHSRVNLTEPKVNGKPVVNKPKTKGTQPKVDVNVSGYYTTNK